MSNPMPDNEPSIPKNKYTPVEGPQNIDPEQTYQVPGNNCFLLISKRIEYERHRERPNRTSRAMLSPRTIQLLVAFSHCNSDMKWHHHAVIFTAVCTLFLFGKFPLPPAEVARGLTLMRFQRQRVPVIQVRSPPSRQSE